MTVSYLLYQLLYELNILGLVDSSEALQIPGHICLRTESRVPFSSQETTYATQRLENAQIYARSKGSNMMWRYLVYHSLRMYMGKCYRSTCSLAAALVSLVYLLFCIGSYIYLEANDVINTICRYSVQSMFASRLFRNIMHP